MEGKKNASLFGALNRLAYCRSFRALAIIDELLPLMASSRALSQSS